MPIAVLGLIIYSIADAYTNCPAPSSAGIDEANAVTIAGICSAAQSAAAGLFGWTCFDDVLTGVTAGRGYNLSPGFAWAPGREQKP